MSVNIKSKRSLITFSLYKMGGDKIPQHSEDIAVETNKLFPGVFTWKKHVNQIDIAAIKYALKDARKSNCESPELVTGNENTGWTLTEKGKKFVIKNKKLLKNNSLDKGFISKQDEERINREAKRIYTTKAYFKYLHGEKKKINKSDAQNFFKINDYLSIKRQKQKIEIIKNIFSKKEHKKIKELITFIEMKL